MGLSDCECGGFIALGPDASNKCDRCGAGVFGRPKERPDWNPWMASVCQCETLDELKVVLQKWLQHLESIPK